jgi:hypothetical protein
MRFSGARDGHLDDSPVGMFHFFLQQDQTCNDIGSVRFNNQWDFALEESQETTMKNEKSSKFTFVTFLNHTFDGPSTGRRSSLRRSAI